MRQSTSYFELKNYFEELVKESNFLEDFVGFFSRELHNKEQSVKGIASPCLALFNYGIGIEGEDSSVSVAVRSLSFGVLYFGVKEDDYEAQYRAIDRGEQEALKVAARLRYDSNIQGHFLYGSFIKNSLEIRPVELSDGGIFGVEVSFKMKNIQSLKLHPEDWKDIDKTC